MKKFVIVLIVLILVGIGSSASFIIRQNVTSKKKVVNLENEITIMGVNYRATNRDLMNSTLMQEAIAKVLSAEIPGVEHDSKFYIVYHDYAQGFKNDYLNSEFTTHVGFAVPKDQEPIEGLSLIHIKNGKYEKYTTEIGKLSMVVGKMWEKIWADKNLLEKRNYVMDFEIYSGTEHSGSAEIYIGVN